MSTSEKLSRRIGTGAVAESYQHERTSVDITRRTTPAPPRPPVAFAERVQGLNLGEELRNPADELLPVQPAQPVRSDQPTEDIGSGSREVLRQTEQRPLGDRHGPELA